MKSKNNMQAYKILPSGETPLWRFMSISKFLYLIHRSAIYLNRADRFADKWEGTFNKESVLAQFGIEYPEDLVRLACWIPTHSFVSCWHASEYESAALWAIYGAKDEGVAIRTTMDALSSLFPPILEKDSEKIISQEICAVQYIDYKAEHPYLNDLCGPLCYKRKAFLYEQEIRIIRMELPTTPKPRKDNKNGSAIQMCEPPTYTGLSLQVDLNKLINAIYIAPNSPSYILDAVHDVLQRYEISIKPQQSDLDDIPEYSYKNLTQHSTGARL